jgi:DNA-binding SARP family transcriptional activator/tetratricopeptide (TPR) repeat protein
VRLAIRLLGEPSLEFDGKTWPFKAPYRCFAILAMLSLDANAPPSRASIANGIWPDLSDEDATANLRRHLHMIQQAMPDVDGIRWISREGTRLAWNETASLWVDVRAFREGVATPATRAQAIELYRGPLLGARGESELLLLSQRDQLRNECIDACLEEAIAARKRLDFAAAIRYTDRVLELDEWREDALRLAMTLRYDSGDRSSALATFERFSLRLGDEMGVDPMPETLALRDTILMNDGVAERPGAGEEPSTAPERFGTPFVGRARELETLEAAWRNARHGRGTTLFVSGEAGIGKTRLLAEFGALVAMQGGRVVVAETSSPESHPYEPIVEALRKSLALIVESPVPQPWLSTIAEVLPELRAAFPDIPPAEPLAADNARARLLEAIARTIERLAKARPLLLVLEDLHWAGAATLDVIEYLARRIGAVPALLVLTFRTGESAPGSPLHALRRRLQSESRSSSLELRALAAGDVETLASTMTGIDDPAVAASVFAISEGNPLFAAQMLRGYVETGSLPPQRSAAATLAHAIISRVATLDAAAKDVIEVAAAFGHSFTIDVLAGVLGWPEGQVVDSMGGPLDRSLIRATRSGSTFAYSFAHELIAASVYETIAPEQRALYHRRIAGLLGTLHGDDPRMAGTIAVHWERAGALDRAGAAFLRAARGALDVYDREGAVTFATRARSFAGDDRASFEAYHVEANARAGWGEVEAWNEALCGLERVAGALGEREQFEAAMLRSLHAIQTTDLGEQEVAIAEMLRLADAASNDDWRMLALDARGYMLTILDEPGPAEEAYERGLALARTAGDQNLAVRFMARLIQSHARHGELDAARKGVDALRAELGDGASSELRMALLFAEAALAAELEDGPRSRRVGIERLELSRSVGDMRSEALAHTSLAFAGHLERDVSAMRSHYDRALTLFERIGDRASLGATYANRGFLEREIGHYHRAREFYERAESYLTYTGDHGRCVLRNNAADIAYLLGDMDAAAALANEAIELSRRVRTRRLEVEALFTLGAVQVRTGSLEPGLASLRLALERASDGVGDRACGDVICLLVETLAAQRRFDEAAPYAAELERRVLEEPAAQRFPTRMCRALVEYALARGDTASERWLQRGRAFLDDVLARFDLAEDREAYASMEFNQALAAAGAT